METDKNPAFKILADKNLDNNERLARLDTLEKTLDPEKDAIKTGREGILGTISKAAELEPSPSNIITPLSDGNRRVDKRQSLEHHDLYDE